MLRRFHSLILGITILLIPMSGVFAWELEDTIASAGRIETTVNNYILSVYKLQGDKILQDLDVSLQKLSLLPQARNDAYMSIQATLKLRKTEILQDKTLQRNSRTILLGYLDYMIQSLEDRQNLSK